jgi:hypothetical protein
MRLRCRGIDQVMERRQLRFWRDVVRADRAGPQGGAEQQAAESHLAGGLNVRVMRSPGAELADKGVEGGRKQEAEGVTPIIPNNTAVPRD